MIGFVLVFAGHTAYAARQIAESGRDYVPLFPGTPDAE